MNHLQNCMSKTQSRASPSMFAVACMVMPLLLCGCTGSTYSSHFDCPMGEGAGCASISKVNKMIDRQEIDPGHDDVSLTKKTCASKLPGRQIYVYYGPDQLSRLISLDENARS